jgi:ElaB/YqjD/DUF883 family membrane-anchored ribosome-binding protein
MADETLDEIRAELDTLAERLGDAAYDSLRAQLRRGVKATKSDPDLIREKLLSRARNAVERASSLVAQAGRGAGADSGHEAPGGDEP